MTGAAKTIDGRCLNVCRMLLAEIKGIRASFFTRWMPGIPEQGRQPGNTYHDFPRTQFWHDPDP
jgi:hypothetical protein